jgi:hypothetical protein
VALRRGLAAEIVALAAAGSAVWVRWLRQPCSGFGLSQKPVIFGVMLLKLRHVVGDCMPWGLLSNEDMPEWARLRLAIQHPGMQHDEVGSLQRNRQW